MLIPICIERNYFTIWVRLTHLADVNILTITQRWDSDKRL